MHTPPLILIVDDDADFKEILSAKLLASGCQIAEAGDGGEGIKKAKSLIPDLIVMDIQMPNVNGTEAVLELKETPSTKDIKVVFFSSLIYPWPGVKSDNPAFAKELGAITFLRKSDDLEKIVATIKALLAGSPLPATGLTPPIAPATPVQETKQPEPAAPVSATPPTTPTPPPAPTTPAAQPVAAPTDDGMEHAPKIVSSMTPPEQDSAPATAPPTQSQ